MALLPPLPVPSVGFYVSTPLPCPYLPGRAERKLFTTLEGAAPVRQKINDALIEKGFRRSNDIAYRPACEACNACKPLRIDVTRFQPTRSQRKTLRRTKNFALSLRPAKADAEHYALFLAYQKGRHEDSEMALMTADDFKGVVAESIVTTCYIDLRDDQGRLLGTMIADNMRYGFSAVYSFFDPAYPRLSLGTRLILALIDAAQQQGKKFVYLGYWIKDLKGMTYKSRFSGLEILTSNGIWKPLESKD